jgi:hypothetical protein
MKYFNLRLKSGGEFQRNKIFLEDEVKKLGSIAFNSKNK